MRTVQSTAEPSTRVRDPVCGMVLDTGPDAAPVLQEVWRGQTFAFCSEACRQESRAAPVRYLPATRSATTGVSDTPGARRIELPLPGIDPAVAAVLDARLRALAGVEQVVVNPASRSAAVVYDPATIGTDELVRAVEEAEVPGS